MSTTPMTRAGVVSSFQPFFQNSTTPRTRSTTQIFGAMPASWAMAAAGGSGASHPKDADQCARHGDNREDRVGATVVEKSLGYLGGATVVRHEKSAPFGSSVQAVAAAGQ